jgi:hypothetical protein
MSLSLVLLASVASFTGCNLFGSSDSQSTLITTDNFSGQVAQNGSALFTFKVSAAGNVSVTLTSVTPATSSALGLGIGTSDGTACVVTASTSSAVAGSAAQLSSTLNPGTSCVKVFDVGNLTAASTVAISVAHP